MRGARKRCCMGSIQEVKEALSAQARTTTLDELRSRGRQQVRVIRAEQVAAMVAEAVERALANSGMVPQDDLDRLVAQSRAQFAEVNRERQREHEQRERLAQELNEAEHALESAELAAQEAREQVRALEERVGELEGGRMRSQELEPELMLMRARVAEMEREIEAHRSHVREQQPAIDDVRRGKEKAEHKAHEAEERAGRLAMELESSRHTVETLQRQERARKEQMLAIEEDLRIAQSRIAELEQELEVAERTTGAIEASADPAAAAQVDVMARVLEELATLKARVNQVPPVPAAAMTFQNAPAAQPPQQGNQVVDRLAAALGKLTQSMTDKMESIGRKMGISGAVESGPVNLDGLFKDLDKQKVESNLDSMEVKSKQAGGIAANLAKLKKLKGN